MRRITARGRLVPQSRSTDPRFGRVSLKASSLYDRMWINADDQGRLSGDPDEIKYTACPNLPDISKEDIPGLLQELEKQQLIKLYSTSVTKAVQMIDWWGEQKLQWAYPSRYPPPDGWTDHLRYHPTPTEIITENWPPDVLPSKPAKELPSKPAKELPSKLQQREKEPKREIEKEGEGGKGRLPSKLGSRPPPSPTDLSTDINKISDKLLESFRYYFGHVEASDPNTVIPREPGGKELAQLRDFALEISAAGGCPLSWIREAFREASGQEVKSKRSVRYVRAILFDWLGIPRSPPE